VASLPPTAETRLATEGPRGLELLRALAQGTAGEIGDEFLRSLVRSLAEAFAAKLAFVAEADRPDGRHVRMLTVWHDGAFLGEPFEYDTAGQPCALIAERPVVAVPEALAARFPEARVAIEMGMDSYLAVCLRGVDGAHLGHMAVLDAGPLSAGDDEIAALRVFASRAAAELERRRQAAALHTSRARVIEAGDAERRRIGRDLHDGAQQRLVAVGNLLKVARRTLDGEGSAKVEPVLEMAADELSKAHAELRDLARGLHPVALGDRGLRAAVDSLAQTCTVRVEVDVTDDALPENVALGAYFVVAESLANAQKYAQATLVRVRAAIAAGTLAVEVADDGAGGADVGAGTGLCGLMDRVEALGGRLDVDSPSGAGTRVRAVVPLERGA
jgi:signal transduction histidine kinase